MKTKMNKSIDHFLELRLEECVKRIGSYKYEIWQNYSKDKIIHVQPREVWNLNVSQLHSCNLVSAI